MKCHRKKTKLMDWFAFRHIQHNFEIDETWYQYASVNFDEIKLEYCFL